MYRDTTNTYVSINVHSSIYLFIYSFVYLIHTYMQAAELMIITNNLVSPRNGEPLVAATQGRSVCMCPSHIIRLKRLYTFRLSNGGLSAHSKR